MQNRASAKATQPQLQYRAKRPTGRRISCPSKDETLLLPRESHTSTLRAGLGVRPGTAVDWEAGLPGPLPTPQSEAVMPWMREFSRATVSLPSCSIPCTHVKILSGPTLLSPKQPLLHPMLASSGRILIAANSQGVVW